MQPNKNSAKVGPQVRAAFPSYKEALMFWLKLGFISFGGPAGQISIMHEFLVDRKKWISESRFMHALNYCMILPGPEAQQLATYIGWLLHGVAGGITAGILFILPGLLVLLGLSYAYVAFGTLPVVAAFFGGLKPAVIGIIVAALVKIGKKSIRHPVHAIIALLSFVLISFFSVSFPLIVLGAFSAGLLFYHYAPGENADGPPVDKSVEGQFIVNANTGVSRSATLRATVGKILIGVALWIVPYAVLVALSADDMFWSSISLFFTKAAFVTFGGAYAVLPYVAQVSVEKYGWLTDLQMIDGMALGESTPGPLILVLVFVGFMAGYNHYSGSVLAGAGALFTTAYFTFLPSFLFIFVGAPLIEQTQGHPRLKTIMSCVTAAVVGVIGSLAFYFGQSVLIKDNQPHWFYLVWSILSFGALHTLRINMIVWLLVSGIAGIVYLLTFGSI